MHDDERGDADAADDAAAVEDELDDGDQSEAESESDAADEPLPLPPLADEKKERPSLLRRLWGPAAFAAALVVVGYVVFNGVEGLLQNDGLDGRIGATQAEIAELELQAAQLAALAAYLDSDAYIERTARETLGMVRPGEEAFAVHAPTREGLAFTRSPWWANLLPELADDDR